MHHPIAFRAGAQTLAIMAGALRDYLMACPYGHDRLRFFGRGGEPDPDAASQAAGRLQVRAHRVGVALVVRGHVVFLSVEDPMPAPSK